MYFLVDQIKYRDTGACRYLENLMAKQKKLEKDKINEEFKIFLIMAWPKQLACMQKLEFAHFFHFCTFIQVQQSEKLDAINFYKEIEAQITKEEKKNEVDLKRETMFEKKQRRMEKARPYSVYNFKEK